MTKPLILVTVGTGRDPERAVSAPVTVPLGLLQVISRSGGVPFVVFEEAGSDPGDLVEMAGGAVIAGGPDVSPLLYGEEPRPGLGKTFWQRDRFEFGIVRHAVAAGKPVLGICRGMQVVNTALGGTLYQDLSEFPGGVGEHAQKGDPSDPFHRVETVEGTRLRKALGERAAVNSRHHEAVKDVAPGFRVAAAAPDGVIEAIEGETLPVFCVQWHPEDLWQADEKEEQLFRLFVSRCAHGTGDRGK
ncbi:MAG: gamma-glutamyl-gamma-aminobutyrate hydrolase family protein [Sutterellaceae bacterium]|nr:gamma-glutamyl-gamma-aminobutyrate hydrolase family protein [Sutterellaceae bacterium]MDY2869004.1 gamma-glutamyl-gamma-aminobutyrate hydrolase family protein [Mesosutterella sp.]